MTEFNEDNVQEAQTERTQMDALADLDIGSLRKVAKALGVSASRDWDKTAYVKAIIAHQNKSIASFVIDGDLAPAPGYARVLIHRDPTPGHKNSPIHVGLNGRLFQVPRGPELDIPYPYVGVLRDAVTVTTEDVSGEGDFVDQRRTSYPFQVLAMTPGEFVNYNDQRAVNYQHRVEFHEKMGHWPTHGELTKYIEAKASKAFKE